MDPTHFPPSTWRAAVENSADFILILEPSGSIAYVNRTGPHVTLDDIIGKSIYDFLAPDEAKHFRGACEQVIHTGKPKTYEADFTNRSGVTRTFNVRTAPIMEQDSVTALAVWARDITELKQTEEKFHAQYQGLPLPTYTWQKVADDFVLIDFNNAARAATDNRVESLRGQKASDLYTDEPDILADLNRCFNGQRVVEREMAYRLRSTGEERQLQTTYAFIPPDLVLVHVVDITERTQAEEALRDSETRLQRIIDSAPDGIAVVDSEGHFLRVNAEACRIFGYSADELIGEQVETLLPKRYRELHAELRQRYNSEPYHRSMGPSSEVVGLRKDGSELPLDISLNAIDGPEDLRVIVAIRDITERKRAEDALQESEERYRTLVELMNEGLGMQGPDGRITFANERLASMLGYTPAELVGRPSMEVIAPTGKSAYTGVRDAATQEGSATAEFELTTKTGRAIWTRISARQLLDDEGGCAGGFAVVTDITDWKRTEEALRESEERFRVSLMHAPVVVFQQDLELRYTWVYNPLGGLVSEDIVGKTDEDIYPPEDVERVTSLKREVLSTGVGRREEGWVRVGGHVMWLDRTIEPLRDEHGDIVGITGASFDITERKSADQELQRAKEEIEGRVDQRLEQSNAYDLTFRELTVLHLVVDGKTDKEIGATLGISPLTVSKHVSNILAKMDVESRTAAGAQAIREGLVS